MVQSIDVRKCNAEKRYAGDLELEFEGEESLVEIPYVSFSSPVRAKLHYEILEDDSVEVKGEISFSLKGACSRCLKETEQHIVGEAEGYFLPNGDPNGEDYAYHGGIVDLREFLRDAVLWNMPARLLCNDNCSAPEYRE